MLIRRIARPLLSVVFIGQGIDSLLNPKAAAEAAAPAVGGLQALPDPVGSSIPSNPQTIAQINAAVQVGGGLLLATGRMPRVASAALAFTVLPGNLGAHMFWSETDPQRKAQKRKEFLTDLSLLGGLMIAAADTAGKPSLGWRGRRAAERLSDAVSSALPDFSEGVDTDFDELGEKIVHRLQARAERGRELALEAVEKAEPLTKKARKRGEKLASEVAEVAEQPWARSARRRGRELADVARVRGEHLAESARHLADSANGHAAEDALERVGSKVKRRLR
ncbi:DoxX family protein [Mycobacterium sp. HUMS_1102779]|uniref:DoxX family protein n=1 Tax=Mycobacterium sp. HUMS_1102779 TaxID=3383487 RepID=UPI00389A9FC5